MAQADPPAPPDPFDGGMSAAAALCEELSLRIPGLEWLLRQVGFDSLESQVVALNRPGDDNDTYRLCNEGSTPTSVVQAWKNHVELRKPPILIEMLLFDYWFSVAPLASSQLLPGNYRFDKTVHTIQQILANLLYDRAKDLTWTRPYTMCRALQLSKIYFKQVLSAEHLVSDNARYQFLGKYAVASALRSRFINVSTNELREAEQYLTKSITAGNTDVEGYAYLTELRLRQYDNNHNIDILKVALRELRNSPVSTPSLKLHEAEMWLKLAARTENENTRIRFLQHAQEHCNAAWPPNSRADQQARKHILKSLITRMLVTKHKAAGASLPGLRLPFGLADSISRCESVDSPLVVLMREVLPDIEKSSPFANDEPLCRRVVADAYAALAAMGPGTAGAGSDFLCAISGSLAMYRLTCCGSLPSCSNCGWVW